MKLRIPLVVAPLLLAAACSFNFDRGSELGPGDVAGSAVLTTGDAAGFARVVVDGTGRILRADRDGTFVVRALPVGTWALRLEYDRDGDGWPEELASRAVQIRQSQDGIASFVDLGTVNLDGPAAVRGTVEAPDGVPTTGAVVTVSRTVALNSAGVDFEASQQVEAQVGAGVDGTFFLPAVEPGLAQLHVFLEVDGERYASEALELEVGPGENQLAEPLVLLLVDDDTDRLVSVFVAPDLEDDERAVISLVRPGTPAPEGLDFEGAESFGFEDSLTLSVPVGIHDVYVLTDKERTGLAQRRSVPRAENNEVLEWGLIQLLAADAVCVPDGQSDCDQDGAFGLPPRDGADDPLWQECLSQCLGGDDFDIEETQLARCEVDGVEYDCEDDGDGQPDPAEPRCYGLTLGADHDGDGLCTPVDPFPYCAANDETCDPDEVTGQYGQQDPDPDPPGPDAGPDPDAGPQPVEPRPPFTREIFTAEGPFGAFGAPAQFLFDEETRTFTAAGSVDTGKGLPDPFESGCAVQRIHPGVPLYYLARFDADGRCLEMAFGGDDTFNASSGLTVIGDQFVVATLTTAADHTPGVDDAGKPLLESTGGQRLIVSRIGADLVVDEVAITPVQAGLDVNFVNVGVDGIAALGIDRVAVAVDCFSQPLTIAPGQPNELVLPDTGEGRLGIVELGSDLSYLGGIEAGVDNAFLGEMIPDGAGGLALTVSSEDTVFSTTAAFGQDFGGTSEAILRFDDQLNVTALFSAFGVESIRLAADSGALHAAVVGGEDRSGVYLMQQSFAAGSGNLQRVLAPDEPVDFSGAIPTVANLNTFTYDPVNGEFVTASATGIQATRFNRTQVLGTRDIGTTTGITRMVLDPVNRRLFYNVAGELRRCDVDDCDSTETTIAASFFGDFDVDAAAQRIYFSDGAGVDRMDYDGGNIENNFYASAITEYITVDEDGGFVFYFDGEGGDYARGTLDVQGSDINLGVSAPQGFLVDLQVDPRDGRVYGLIGRTLFSFASDGSDLQTINVLGGAGDPTTLGFVRYALPEVRGAGGSATVDFDAISIARLEAAPTVALFANGALDSLSVEALATQGGALFVLGDISEGRAPLDASSLELRADNEANPSREVFLVRLVDDGQRFVPDWMSQSTCNGSCIVRGLGVLPDGDLFIGGRANFEGQLGQEIVTGGTFLWHLPPEGEGAPPPRPQLGGEDAATLLGALSAAPRVLPHGDGGWLGGGQVQAGDDAFLERADAQGSSWRHDFPDLRLVHFDVADSGVVAALLEFEDAFTFDGLSHTIDGLSQGAVALVFDPAGNLLASSFAELSGGSQAQKIAVRDDGSFAVLYNITDTYSLDDAQAAPATGDTGGTDQGLLVLHDASGRVAAHHQGAGTFSFGSDLDLDERGGAVVVFAGQGFSVTGAARVAHFDAAGALDLEIGVEPVGVTPTLGVTAVSLSRPGGLLAVSAPVTAGTDDVTFHSSTCGSNTETPGTPDAVRVQLFRAEDGCPTGGVDLELSAFGSQDPEMRFVDAAGNLVVVGTFTDSMRIAPDQLATSTTRGASPYVAFLSGTSFNVSARTLRITADSLNPVLLGFGSYAGGQVWLRVNHDDGSNMVFSDDAANTRNIGTDGYVWHLEGVDDLTEATLD